MQIILTDYYYYYYCYYYCQGGGGRRGVGHAFGCSERAAGHSML